MLRWITCSLAACAVVAAVTSDAGEPRFNYTVQLVRATDTSESLPPGSAPVSPELSRMLHGPLKWRHYWNVCERRVQLEEGRAKRIPLTNAREVEIDLTSGGKRTVTAFQGGKAVARSEIPRGGGISLIGGPRDASSGWFVVVRRDKAGH